MRRYKKSSWFSLKLPVLTGMLTARHLALVAGMTDLGDGAEIVETLFHGGQRAKGKRVREHFMIVIRRLDEHAQKENTNGTAEG